LRDIKKHQDSAFETLVGEIDGKRKEYGRINSAEKLVRKKAKAAVDPIYAEELKNTNKGYRDKAYGKVKVRRVEDKEWHTEERAKRNIYQQGYRKKNPGTIKKGNDAAKAKREADPVLKATFEAAQRIRHTRSNAKRSAKRKAVREGEGTRVDEEGYHEKERKIEGKHTSGGIERASRHR